MKQENDRMAVNEILQVALQKEQQARDFYAAMLADCSIDFIRDLLLALQNEESKHIRMIENTSARLE